ncbi:hypothetical protein ZBT109_0789 [Zymobacter palmae]|uniref:Uncharacterized protein n=1 Tax=Zymobacter palmae TaxID=33074 RepID=A0A348HD63_9GAMM|nr:hypothetical protein ZBT109_0789 [Zymobacter palmae]
MKAGTVTTADRTFVSVQFDDMMLKVEVGICMLIGTHPYLL